MLEEGRGGWVVMRERQGEACPTFCTSTLYNDLAHGMSLTCRSIATYTYYLYITRPWLRRAARSASSPGLRMVRNLQHAHTHT